MLIQSRMRKAGLAFAALLAVPFVVAAPATAQDYPVKGKTITIIVPYAPGGVTDTGARMMAAELEKAFGTPVQVANKVGAASQLGLSELVRAAPDGYTLSYAVLPTVVTHYVDKPSGAPYTRKDFQPIAMHHYLPQTLSVLASSPWKTLKEFVEDARAKPEGLKISDSGLLAVPHSSVLMLQLAADVRFASVHFGGGAPSVTALLGGHVDAMAGGTADALPNKKTGQFRVLGVAAETPSPSMPDVPTMKSQGYDVLAASATGIVAPAGTPPAVVAKLTSTIKSIIESPDHSKKLSDLSIDPYYLDPEAFSKLWTDNETRMKPLLEKFKQ